jgi:FtsZ-binding cell division protein ZapB
MGMPEEKKRINAVIDMDLYVKITEAGYGISEAVTRGFEKLLEVPEGNTQYKEELPNDGLITGLQAQVKELQDHNVTLKNELEKAERDKEDLKTTYNNYFLQVQTLINQKAIEAPGEKRKPFWKFW